ncbi:hypothetical protein ACOMCU_22360 [Lysinibacillus sp. UGB7]|uniref:hypothetical protein n=1 Tax=Lysinibacillus sp. UGB7 TaxID=3411039 RepID=UPI003B75FBAD
MTATNASLVHYFQLRFNGLDLNNEEEIFMFVNNALVYAEEIHISNEDSSDELQKLPLLAILSEVQRTFPGVLEKMKDNSPIIAKSLDILSCYTDAKRDLLKDVFLKSALVN